MIKGWFAAIALLLSFNASATETESVFYLCNWCETRNDFINVAESNGRSLPVINEAEYDVIVANDVENVLYKGRLLVENWNGTIHTTAFLQLASTDLHAAYVDFKAFSTLSEDRKLVVKTPPSTWYPAGGGSSFLYSNLEGVAEALTSDPLHADYINEHFIGVDNFFIKSLELLFKGIFTKTGREFPEFIVIFENGDVATYKILKPYSNIDIVYVEGSARDRFGTPIADGSGITTGGGYVGPSVHGGVRIRPGNEGSDWLVCARVGSGPWTCYVEEDVQ